MSLLDDTTIDERLSGLPQWRREGGEIVRDLELADFAAALGYVNAVGEIAERRNHHPDVRIHGWNKVELRISNHSAGGLTEDDFALAGELDGVR